MSVTYRWITLRIAPVNCVCIFHPVIPTCTCNYFFTIEHYSFLSFSRSGGPLNMWYLEAALFCIELCWFGNNKRSRCIVIVQSLCDHNLRSLWNAVACSFFNLVANHYIQYPRITLQNYTAHLP